MSKVKIKVSSFNHILLDKAIGQIVSVAIQNGGNVCGPVPMPTKHKRFALNRSPHVNKKSREVLYLHTHTKFVIISADSGSGTLKSLQSINLEPGIGIKLKTLQD